MSEARHPFPIYAFVTCARSHLPFIKIMKVTNKMQLYRLIYYS